MKNLACLLILCLFVNLRAQEPQDVVRISTSLVQLDIVVTKDGKQVTHLKPEDFEILEDGKPQKITHFAYVSANPPAASSETRSETETVPSLPKPPLPSEVKRTVAIVVDDLGMSFQSMANLRNYLRKFLAENLKPNDLVAIIRTGSEVGALQQFTTDRQVLASAVADLKWNPCSRVGVSVVIPQRSLTAGTPPEPQMRDRSAADRSPSSNQTQRPTTANESNPCAIGNSVTYSINALRFILRGMRDLPGRKSMMIVSDNLPMERQEENAAVDFGFSRPVRERANLIDVWTQSTNYADGLQGLADQAIRSSVVIYGVSSQGIQATGALASDEVIFPANNGRGRGSPPTALQNLVNARTAELRKQSEGADLLAKETGGFMMRNKNDFGLDRVLEDQNGYYLIGYRPAGETFNRRRHSIQAHVKHGGFTVRTRAGYYGVTEEPTPGPPSERDRMNKALVSPFAADEVSMRLTSLFANDPSRGSLLRMFLAIDGKDLTFAEEADGTRVAKFDLSTVLFGENGAVVNRQDQSATLRLRGRPYERALQEGVVYALDLPLKHAGAFQLRVALRDAASQRIGAAGQFVQAPNLGDGQLALSGILFYADTPNRDPSADDEWRRGLVLRRFPQGTSLVFGYTIYNAALNKKTQQPQLTTQTLVFRDGVKIYNSDHLPVEAAGQTDLQRIATGARLQLGPALIPGEYVVQIVVEDQVAKRSATQLTQFEVVK